MRDIWLKGSAIVVICLLLTAFGRGQGLCSDEKIRLGFVADISGVGIIFYKSQKAAIDLFIEEANAGGGLLGKKLEVVVRDAKLKPSVGAEAATALIQAEKCDFLIGPTSSAVALAVTKVAQKHKKIVCFHTSNSEALTTTDFQPYMFQVVPSTGAEARGCALFFSEKPYKKYAHVGFDYAYGYAQWDAFKTELVKHKPGVEIQKAIWAKPGTTYFPPFISTLRKLEPDVVVSSLWGSGLSTFIKQAHPYGLFRDSAFMGLFDLDLLKEIGRSMPEGLIGYARCPFYAVENPQMKAFVKKYREKYNAWPSDWAIAVYDGLIALTEAVKKAGTIDSDAVVKALEGLHFKSLRGERYIRDKDHTANMGIYIGTTAKDPKYPEFLILKDVQEIPAEKIWFSMEKKKIRRIFEGAEHMLW